MSKKVILDQTLIRRQCNPIFSTKNNKLHITGEDKYSPITNIIDRDERFLDMAKNGGEVFMYLLCEPTAKNLVGMRRGSRNVLPLAEGTDYIIVGGERWDYIVFRKGIFSENDFWYEDNRPNQFAPAPMIKFYFNQLK